MSKPLLSSATEQALGVIAHAMMADGIAKNVEGMADFGKFYRARLMTRDQKIIDRFEALCRKAQQDFLRALEQDEA